jgi:putative flavoprotein involved in K+ transport
MLREVGGIPAQMTGLLLNRLPAAVADNIGRVAQRLTIGDLSKHGLPPATRGIYTAAVQDDQIPILDVGLVEMLKAGRVEVVAAVEGFDRDDVLLADGSRVAPDAVIACAGYRRGLEPLVGHLGLIGDKGRPIVHDESTHPDYPSLYFIGYTNPITGMFRQFGIDARRIARARLA